MHILNFLGSPILYIFFHWIALGKIDIKILNKYMQKYLK